MEYLLIFILLVISIFLIAIITFSYFEHWDLLDSLYYTTGVVTVGDSDLFPNHHHSKFLSIFMMLFGYISISFIVSIIATKIIICNR